MTKFSAREKKVKALEDYLNTSQVSKRSKASKIGKKDSDNSVGLRHNRSLSSHQFSEYDATKDRKKKDDPFLDNSDEESDFPS
jgi:hypothetical protein